MQKQLFFLSFLNYSYHLFDSNKNSFHLAVYNSIIFHNLHKKTSLKSLTHTLKTMVCLKRFKHLEGLTKKMFCRLCLIKKICN